MNIWPFSTIRRLREENMRLTAKSQARAEHIARLTAELEQARRNDYRDKTGKFAKRPEVRMED